MIDLDTYEVVKLEDIADFGRAKQGHIYPAGTSWIQISATRGQLGYLTHPSEIHTKNVAIIPQGGLSLSIFTFQCKPALMSLWLNMPPG